VKSQTNIISYLIAVVSAVVTFIVVGMLSYFTACYFAPPVVIDTITGQVHGLMPIGQSIIAILVATIASIITLLLVLNYFRKQRKKT
jgi:hypothetical protein